MGLILLVVFIAVPVVEIALFIEVGGRLGLWSTLALVILTAAIGSSLLRAQGLGTLRRAQDSFARNVVPVAELFDGLCLLVAGVLLLTPGFFTDALGFLLLAPPIRRLARDWLWQAVSRGEGARIWVNGEEITPGRDGRSGETIEGEYREVRPDRDDDRLPK